MNWTTKAAFRLPGKQCWTWIRWTHQHANKHAAILEMAETLRADAWDFGQADHFESSRFPVSR